MNTKKRRLIEAGFPCHQVGAETQRERGASSALPPLYFLHIWWARRPLTPSRAAILASLLDEGFDPDLFVRQLGIEKMQAMIGNEPWTLNGELRDMVKGDPETGEELPVTAKVLRLLAKEEEQRAASIAIINDLRERDRLLYSDPTLAKWEAESRTFPRPLPGEGAVLPVRRVAADPAWFKALMQLAQGHRVKVPNLYGYDRAYTSSSGYRPTGKVVLDPTAGGGSIPFEALRLGHTVIANDLNPVATTILTATLDFPARFGKSLLRDIANYGERLFSVLDNNLDQHFARSGPLPPSELRNLMTYLGRCPAFAKQFAQEEVTSYLFVRQVTCPHCGGQAPLLNTCWLSKEADDPWGVRIVTDGKARNGTVQFEPFRVSHGHGPNGEDPAQTPISVGQHGHVTNLPGEGTCHRGDGLCVHCRQTIDGDEIKAQARGESPNGKWTDRLYAIVAVRFQPKLDRDGQPERFKSGERKGEIKTEKVRFFRAPVERDLSALKSAQESLAANRMTFDELDVIPSEEIVSCRKNGGCFLYGMTRWADLFTDRQLLGHATLIRTLNELKSRILADLGGDRGRAVVTYLQFAIDKGLDYNSKQTRWHYSRGSLVGTFSRHDLNPKWTFGEMIFAGPNSGARWGLSQVLDAYAGLCDLVGKVGAAYQPSSSLPLRITNGSAAHLEGVADRSVDLVCMDPPYYDNVQYAELSDFFYVWQKRTLADLYPDACSRRLVNKVDEAVANIERHGGVGQAKIEYETKMAAIFKEALRVLKADGLLTIMFTHKTQDAWETLTRSLIEAGWAITAAFPVDSEGENSMHQRDLAAAASSIFITCRKRKAHDGPPATWTGFGGAGVQHRVREAVRMALREFAPLKLNPVDEMVAAYGRALQVLSENWPVMDGDSQVGPGRAMLEASREVTETQISRLTDGRLTTSELDAETAMSLIILGIFGHREFPYDEALVLSRSLNIALDAKSGGYTAEGRMLGINTDQPKVKTHAPVVRKGGKLWLSRPEQRDPQRLAKPQTDWDVLHGLLEAFRQGDIPVARAYLAKHGASRGSRPLDLLRVWAGEADSPDLKREADALLFGLGQA